MHGQFFDLNFFVRIPFIDINKKNIVIYLLMKIFTEKTAKNNRIVNLQALLHRRMIKNFKIFGRNNRFITLSLNGGKL